MHYNNNNFKYNTYVRQYSLLLAVKYITDLIKNNSEWVLI